MASLPGQQRVDGPRRREIGRVAPDASGFDSRTALAGTYDAIVIGTGLGGLTAAAILARSGKRVLAVERHDRVGGYAHSFRRGPYLFDAAVHLVGGCEGGNLIDRLLRGLAVRDRCQFVAVDPCYQTYFPDFSLAAPTGLHEFTGAYQRAFPEDAAGIQGFLEECSTMRADTSRLLAGERPESRAAALQRLHALQRRRKATVADVLNTHVTSSPARAALTTLWPYVGLPPERLSFLYWAAMLMTYVEDGAYYCRGTFQVLANTLADVVRESGGDVALRCQVRKVDIDSSGVAGIVLDDGRRIAARTVLSNADARQTVHELVGCEHFPTRYQKSLTRLQPSLSALVAYLATDLPADALPGAHETFYFASWDHEESYATSLAGAPSWFTLTVPTSIDADLAPPGDSLIVFTTLVPFGAVANWREVKKLYRQRIIDAIGTVIPGLSSHLKLIEVGTPQTMQRYTRNSAGALYGWALSPNQIGPGRPSVNPPVPGLYLAGHWTQPGGGVYGVVTSGVLAARAILGHDTEDALWRALEPA
jgi:prolycopene isomerase